MNEVDITQKECLRLKKKGGRNYNDNLYKFRSESRRTEGMIKPISHSDAKYEIHGHDPPGYIQCWELNRVTGGKWTLLCSSLRAGYLCLFFTEFVMHNVSIGAGDVSRYVRIKADFLFFFLSFLLALRCQRLARRGREKKDVGS